MFGISSHRQIYEFSGIPHLFRKIYSRFGIDFVICRPNRTFSISQVQSRTLFGLCRGEKTKKEIQRFRQAERRTERSSDSTEARKRRMKFNDSPLPQTVATGVRLGVPSETRRREEPSGLRICAWPGRGTKCSSTSVRRRAARSPCGSSWPSMRRRLRSRRNSTSAGPSSLRRALSDGC